MSCIQNHAPRQ